MLEYASVETDTACLTFVTCRNYKISLSMLQNTDHVSGPDNAFFRIRVCVRPLTAHLV